MLVLDTHALYWWANQTPGKLAQSHVNAIETADFLGPVSRMIAELAATLLEHHKDPVDRIIIATAIAHQAQLVSVDERFPEYRELADLLVKT